MERATKRPLRRILTACAALAGLAAGAWPAEAAAPTAAVVEAVASRALAEGKGADQLSNPAYRRAQDRAPADGQWIDPFRRGWSGTRGVELPVRFPNRYGAELFGVLYRPIDLPAGPMPGVVVVPGLGHWATDYASISQQLAEHGYVVLAVEPQGQHLSEPDPDPQYCGGSGWWREPQEGGLTEDGPCAGQDPPLDPAEDDGSIVFPAAPVLRAVDPRLYDGAVIAASGLQLRTDPEPFLAGLGRQYESGRTRFTFAGIDAADWLVSPANPWHDLVDATRIGIAGHSAGADGAVMAGNVHRHGLFDAAVAWDSYSTVPDGFEPRVPTMWQQAEVQNFAGPWVPTPDPELWPAYRWRAAFERSGVDSYVFAMRGSTHQEWTFPPDLALMPPPQPSSSSLGLQVATYFTLAWFDLYLKGDPDAADRLATDRFDASVDGTSIGTGRYDVLRDRNVPPTLAGRDVDDHRSRLFRSVYAFEGRRCTDVGAGCGRLDDR